jgi:hypothetical protein
VAHTHAQTSICMSPVSAGHRRDRGDLNMHTSYLSACEACRICSVGGSTTSGACYTGRVRPSLVMEESEFVACPRRIVAGRMAPISAASQKLMCWQHELQRKHFELVETQAVSLGCTRMCAESEYLGHLAWKRRNSFPWPGSLDALSRNRWRERTVSIGRAHGYQLSVRVGGSR